MSDVLEKTSYEIKIVSDVFLKKSNVFGWNSDETNTKCHENGDLLP